MSSISKKALLIDDSEMQRALLRDILHKMNFEVFEAENGRLGLDKIIECAQDFNIVFCDVNMPVLSGLEMLEQYRAYCQENPHIKALPIIMLTSEADRESIVRGKAAGAAGWLIKPAKQEHIAKLLNVFAAA
ncbi:MAG: response regulator [Oligoflexales bacterium]|nr:response regulator [Oligoflexales bacterium]